jgi:hypothetical protein
MTATRLYSIEKIKYSLALRLSHTK